MYLNAQSQSVLISDVHPCLVLIHKYPLYRPLLNLFPSFLPKVTIVKNLHTTMDPYLANRIILQ